MKIANNLNYLFIINNIISKEFLNNISSIYINYYKANTPIYKPINLNNIERIIQFLSNPIDIILIKILKDDNIPNDICLNPDYNYKNGNEHYNEKYIYTFQYPLNENYYKSFYIRSKIKSIDNYKFVHSLNFFNYLPIFLEENNYVIGINNHYSSNRPFNGIFISLYIEKIYEIEIQNKNKKININFNNDIKYGKGEIRYKSNEINNNSRIKELDYLIKDQNNNYELFFKFIQSKNNSIYFVNTSIFDKDEYSIIKYEFLEKLKNNNFSTLEKICIVSILGMAIGDAIGARVEFKPLNYNYNKVKDMGNQPEGIFNLKPGQWTDDTSMGLCIADSLIEKKGEFNPRDIMMRFILWWYSGYNNTFRLDNDRTNKHSIGLGGNINGSFKEYIKKRGEEKFTNYGNKNTSGNGSIMRNAAIPICYYKDEKKALELAKMQSLITHQGYEAAGCCQLLTFIIIKIINSKLKEYNRSKYRTII